MERPGLTYVDVVDAAQYVSLAFGPHNPMQQRSDDTSVRCLLIRPYWQVGTNPIQVVVARSAAGDYQESIVVQSRYREVALDSAALSEQRGVSDGADRFVQLISGEMLQSGAGAPVPH